MPNRVSRPMSRLMLGAVFVFVAGCGDSGGDDLPPPSEAFALPEELVPVDDEFLVAIVPDTQIYAERFPETFDRHLSWLAERAADYRIVFVSHVGDVVQTAENAEEWVHARRAFDFIDAVDLPHGLSLASHDWGDPSGLVYDPPFDGVCPQDGSQDCTSWDFRANFGPHRFVDRPWYRGASPSGNSSYQIVEIEGLKLLFLHLRMNTPRPEVAWAQGVLDEHPDALVHLTTHRYMYDYRFVGSLPFPLSLLPGGRLNSFSHSFGQSIPDPTRDMRADQLFREFVYPNTNIFAVHCGHVDAEFRQVSTNAAGLPVHEVLVDFQNMADGGGGWLRLLKFRPSANEVVAFTFSTETGEVRENGDGLDHTFDVLNGELDGQAETIAAAGLDVEQLRTLLGELATERRGEYAEQLYGAGHRDSHFTMSVDFDAYPASLRN
jgi:hypothetical protein